MPTIGREEEEASRLMLWVLPKFGKGKHKEIGGIEFGDEFPTRVTARLAESLPQNDFFGELILLHSLQPEG